uniref:Conorfamide-As2 n=1 Tax=Conus cancellatus TaxID=289020 RepID=CRF2_CONCF|nr:RecName: Full=Conorfamide-As2; AltName: Full=Conorfamide-As2a; Short=CNF-As2a; Short=Cono-RFamide-As2a; AltName: Full=Conorfamide-As2b; Short=CNF-As2b; Short=Cono-RFamide-As2b [Conus cancellatus]
RIRKPIFAFPRF